MIIRDKKFDPTVVDGDGNTVLHHICCEFPTEIAREMLTETANWDGGIKNKNGDDVLDHYKKQKRGEAADETLLQALSDSKSKYYLLFEPTFNE